MDSIDYADWPHHQDGWKSGMDGKDEFDLTVTGSDDLGVKTDWNCSLSAWTFSTSVVQSLL